MEVLVHQLGFAKRENCAWRVICDWSLEIALRDCAWRLSFEIGASTRFRLKSCTFLVDFCSGFSFVWRDIPLKHEFQITNWIVHKFLVSHSFAWNPNFFPKSISLTFKPITVCQKNSIECNFIKMMTKLNKQQK